VARALNIVRQKLSSVSSCKFQFDQFFADILKWLREEQKTGDLSDSMALISSVLLLIMEKCGEFPANLSECPLYSELSHYSSVPEVVVMFSEMCYLSDVLCKQVLELGVYNAIWEICQASIDEDGDSQAAWLWFMLNVLKHCDPSLIRQSLPFAFQFRPPVPDKHIVKCRIFRILDLFASRRELLQILRDSEIPGKIWLLNPDFQRLLENMGELLESEDPLIVRSCLKFVVTITRSEYIKNIPFVIGMRSKMIVVPRVARCLLLSDEGVHVGVCAALVNLLHYGITQATELSVGFVREFIRGNSFGDVSGARKISIRYFVHNILVGISEGRLKLIFDKVLIEAYFKAIMDDALDNNNALLRSLPLLMQHCERNLGIKAGDTLLDRMTSYLQDRGFVLKDGEGRYILPTLSLLLMPEGDEWFNLGESLVQVWDHDYMNGYYPVTWRLPPTDSFGRFWSGGGDVEDSILVLDGMQLPSGFITGLKMKLSCDECTKMFCMILSVGGCMNRWKTGCAFRAPGFPKNDVIVPLHWYEEFYNTLKGYCLDVRPEDFYHLMRGSSGIGKSTFVTYMICRWLSDSEWLNPFGNVIDTILIRFWKQPRPGKDSVFFWYGFRKLNDRNLIFFQIENDPDPVTGRSEFVVIKNQFSMNFDKGKIDELFEWDTISEEQKTLSVNQLTTLFIFDALQWELSQYRPPLALALASVGCGRRQNQSSAFEKVAYIPMPTANDMGRIYYLLPNESARATFKRCFAVVGYDIRQCLKSWQECYSSLDEVMTTFDFTKFEGGCKLAINIFFETSIHFILKLIPKRGVPWMGLSSLHWGFDLKYASKIIRHAVTMSLVNSLMNAAMNVSAFLSTWSGAQRRALLGELMEELFYIFAETQVLHGEASLGEFVKKTKKRKKGADQDDVDSFGFKLLKDWKNRVLCKQMKVVKGSPVVPKDVEYVLYRAESSRQKLWDAVVVPRDPLQAVDVIQITVAASHGMAIEEFVNLFNSLPNRAFNFLMIRTVINAAEIFERLSATMTWGFSPLSKEIVDSLKKVDFYECIWNFEEALVKDRTSRGIC
jgi:hypothetical protein